MYLLPKELSIDYILSKVSQEEIMERFLGVPVQIGEPFCSPLRPDKNPTCKFYYKGSVNRKLYFKDFGGHFAGDCFNLIQRLYSCSFPESLKIIARQFKLLGLNAARPDLVHEQFEIIQKKKDIKVQWKEWSLQDEEYWLQFGVTRELAKLFKIAPVEKVWIDDEICYTYNQADPAYGYYFSPVEIKVYFPLRELWRFVGNSSCLQGYNQLPKNGDLLVITKSYKDVAALRANGFYALAPQSETVGITKEQYQDLSSRFKNLVTLYDFDLTGIRTANRMRKLYGIPTRFFTNGRFGTINFKAKDYSDLIKNKDYVFEPEEFEAWLLF